jgi:hypothetical protein
MRPAISPPIAVRSHSRAGCRSREIMHPRWAGIALFGVALPSGRPGACHSRGPHQRARRADRDRRLPGGWHARRQRRHPGACSCAASMRKAPPACSCRRHRGGLLALSAERMHHALGIAGSMGAGLMAAQEGAMVERLHAGRALLARLISQRVGPEKKCIHPGHVVAR